MGRRGRGRGEKIIKFRYSNNCCKHQTEPSPGYTFQIYTILTQHIALQMLWTIQWLFIFLTILLSWAVRNWGQKHLEGKRSGNPCLRLYTTSLFLIFIQDVLLGSLSRMLSRGEKDTIWMFVILCSKATQQQLRGRGGIFQTCELCKKSQEEFRTESPSSRAGQVMGHVHWIHPNVSIGRKLNFSST